MDRISELPEYIRHRILNFLDQKEVARTAVVSKTWRSTADYYPVLRFSELTFLCRRDVLVNVIDQSIQKFVTTDLCLNKFVLTIISYDPHFWDPILRRWMKAAVKHLDLDISTRIAGLPKLQVKLPPTVFCSRTITSLRLRNCCLEHCHGADLPNLLELNIVLSTVCPDAIHDLLSGCPNLEICRFWCCGGGRAQEFSSIWISGLTRLKTLLLGIGGLSRVRVVDAHALQCFEFRCSSVPSKSNIELLGCQFTLRKLTLSIATVNWLEDISNYFPLLEELTLVRVPLKCLKIHYHPVLSKINISGCSNLDKIEIDAPNLCLLKYHDNKLPYSVTTSFSAQERLDLNLCFSPQSFLRAVESYKQLLLKLNQYKYVKFIAHYLQDVIVCDEFGENFFNMVHEEGNNKHFVYICCITIKTDECMLDYLFKSRRWRTISLISRDHRIKTNLLEAMNKKTLKDNEEPNCCRASKKKCWQHLLDSVEMIQEDSVESETRNVFKFYDSVEYEITHVKLHWTIPEPGLWSC